MPIISNSPLLPVRVTEAIMGRISMSRLAMVVPAHFIGCVLALAVVRSMMPILPHHVSIILCRSTSIENVESD